MRPSTAGHLAMLLFSALVAEPFALGVLAANEIAPEALCAVRFIIASVLLGVLCWWSGGIPKSALRAIWRYFLLGGVFSIYFVLMFEGLKTVDAVSAATVFTLTPILSAVFGWLLLRQVMTARIAVALGVGGIGAIWVIFDADWVAIANFEIGRGEVIYFWGCVAHAVYTPLVAKLHRGESPVVFSFGTLLGGTFVLVLWAMPAALQTDWVNLPSIVWVTIFYTAIFSSAATFTLLQFATLRLPSSKVMAYTYLTPSWVLLRTLAMGTGTPDPMVLIGVGLTVIALLLLLRNDSSANSYSESS